MCVYIYVFMYLYNHIFLYIINTIHKFLEMLALLVIPLVWFTIFCLNLLRRPLGTKLMDCLSNINIWCSKKLCHKRASYYKLKSTGKTFVELHNFLI